MRALGIRYKGFGENGTREYGNGANPHAISLRFDLLDVRHHRR
jgi:hypothetical protein